VRYRNAAHRRHRAPLMPNGSRRRASATSRVPRKIMASNANRRKTVKKRRPNGGGRLDELLTVHAAGDSRPETLVGRYGGSVTPVSTIAAKTVPHPKRPKTAAKKPLGTRLARLYDPQGHPQGQPRLVGYARVSTDEQTTALQLDALRAAGASRSTNTPPPARRNHTWPQPRTRRSASRRHHSGLAA